MRDLVLLAAREKNPKALSGVKDWPTLSVIRDKENFVEQGGHVFILSRLKREWRGGYRKKAQNDMDIVWILGSRDLKSAYLTFEFSVPNLLFIHQL